MMDAPLNWHTRFGPIREYIEQQLVEQVFPSLAVAVAWQGEIVWEEGFGWADRERRIPATSHTPYSLASISKPITATSLMILRERGLLDLDRPIDDYLGAAKLTARVGAAQDATVRRVANHTAGLPLHYHFFPVDEPIRPPPRDETIRRYANLVTAPGERFQYSNLGYGILDHVISRLSGKTYADFLRDEVFRPLGMNRSTVGIGADLDPYAAARYRGGTERLPFYDFDHPGGSAVFCSAHDLIRFGLFHLKAPLPDQKAILSDASLDEQHRATASSAPNVGYGVGWRSHLTESGFQTFGHTGGMDGVSTALEIVPAEEVAIVVLGNAAGPLPHGVLEEIKAVMLPGYQKTSPGHSTAEGASFTPPTELLGTWTGEVHRLEGNLPFRLTFQTDGDVHARLGDQLTTLLNDVRWQDRWLTGRLSGDIGTADASRRPYYLHADLRQRENRLEGALIASSLPGTRFGNALSHWVSLTKSD